MKLRRPCEHDRYEEHPYLEDRTIKYCPGGEFLPELVDVDRDGLRKALEDAEYIAEQGNDLSPSYRDRVLLASVDAARNYLALLDSLKDE